MIASQYFFILKKELVIILRGKLRININLYKNYYIINYYYYGRDGYFARYLFGALL